MESGEDHPPIRRFLALPCLKKSCRQFTPICIGKSPYTLIKHIPAESRPVVIDRKENAYFTRTEAINEILKWLSSRIIEIWRDDFQVQPVDRVPELFAKEVWYGLGPSVERRLQNAIKGMLLSGRYCQKELSDLVQSRVIRFGRRFTLYSYNQVQEVFPEAALS